MESTTNAINTVAQPAPTTASEIAGVIVTRPETDAKSVVSVEKKQSRPWLSRYEIGNHIYRVTKEHAIKQEHGFP